MPLCKDRAAKELGDKGYCLVKYPRANIAPLDVIAGDSPPLEWLGPLPRVWTSRSNPPAPTENSAPNFTYQRSDEFTGSFAVKILQGLIQNIGGAKASGTVSISSSLSFTYEAPKQLVVSLLDVGGFLKAGDLDTQNPAIARYLEIDNATDTHFYVVTEVLRARRLVVRVTGANSAGVAADVTALQGMVSGNASVTNKSTTESSIAFDGNVDLTFAFKAFELGFVSGNWAIIDGASTTDVWLSANAIPKPVRFADRPVKLVFPE